MKVIVNNAYIVQLDKGSAKDTQLQQCEPLRLAINDKKETDKNYVQEKYVLCN